MTNDGSVVANGLVIVLEAGRPFRIGYEIRCDERWRVQEVRVATLDPRGGRSSSCSPTGRATGREEAENLYSELDGCIDVDISATPFTNTLPIRRLQLEPGESQELTITYVRVPELLVGPERPPWLLGGASRRLALPLRGAAERVRSRATGRRRRVGDRLSWAFQAGVVRITPAGEETLLRVCSFNTLARQLPSAICLRRDRAS